MNRFFLCGLCGRDVEEWEAALPTVPWVKEAAGRHLVEIALVGTSMRALEDYWMDDRPVVCEECNRG